MDDATTSRRYSEVLHSVRHLRSKTVKRLQSNIIKIFIRKVETERKGERKRTRRESIHNPQSELRMLQLRDNIFQGDRVHILDLRQSSREHQSSSNAQGSQGYQKYTPTP